MKVLAVLSQKGGVGKTTLATCLAVAAEASGKHTAIFDLDPQATASFWKDVRKSDTPAVESIQAVRLPAMLKAAEAAGADLAIIDGAAVARDIAFQAAKCADFVLLPTKAAVFDSMSMIQTIDVIKQADKLFALVLNFVPPQGQETTDAITAAEQLNAPVCPVLIGNRKAFFRAQSAGLAAQEYDPGSKAADEINCLYEYTLIYLYNDEAADHANHQDQGELAAGSSRPSETGNAGATDANRNQRQPRQPAAHSPR